MATTDNTTTANDEQLRRELLDRALNHGTPIEKAVEVAIEMYEFIKSGKSK